MANNNLQIKKQVQNKLLTANEIKVELHDNVYSRQTLIDSLIKIIEEKISIFHAEFDPNSRTIYIKIKKSNIKKLSNSIQGGNSYYALFNDIMNDFFNSNYEQINELSNNKINMDSLGGSLSSMYDLLILSDNLIALRL